MSILESHKSLTNEELIRYALHESSDPLVLDLCKRLNSLVREYNYVQGELENNDSHDDCDAFFELQELTDDIESKDQAIKAAIRLLHEVL